MIPLFKPTITAEMKEKVLEVLDSGRYVKGEKAEEFGDGVAEYCGVKHGIAVNSGTAAIYLALRALDIKCGDEVIVPSHTFIATVEPILMLGAKPVFVDISDDYLMDVDTVHGKMTEKTKAVICVHLYGQMCDMDNLIKNNDLACSLTDSKVFLIEDAAQAIGAEYKNHKAGSFGALSCFSFFPSKGITVAGEGGAVVTNNETFAFRTRFIHNHGRIGGFILEIGFNFRMSEISGVVGTEQLKHLDEWIGKRRRIAKLYDELLPDDIIRPKEHPGRKHSYHQYVIRTKNRGELKAFLQKKGIETGISYPVPVHKQLILKDVSVLPKTEQICKEILSLPMYPDLKNVEVEKVCDAITEFCKK